MMAPMAQETLDVQRAGALADFTIEHLEEAVFWIDASARVRRVNAAAAASLGYSREELVQLRVPDFNPDVSEAWWADHWARFQVQPTQIFEALHRGRDGRDFPVQVHSRFIEFEGEAFVCAIVRDVRCKQQHEELLRSSTLAKVSPALIFRTNRFGRWTWVSERWTHLTGVPVEDALVDRWTERVHPDDRASVQEGLRQAVVGRVPWQAEFRLVGRGGQEIFVFGQATPENDGPGPSSYVGALLDVTTQNRAARALLEAKEAAEAANRSKSEFLANMSHELRTPLNGILGYAQLLARDPGMGRHQRDGVEKIRQAGEHLLTLINDVLDLARIEAGRLLLEPVDFCFVDVLDSLADMARVRAEEKGLEFVYLPAPAFPSGVRGDQRKLRQIMLNLLGNAVKFTEQGRVVLQVSAQPDGWVRLAVKDTGVGVPADQLERIFEPFAQVGERRGGAEGTGLGLSICRELARVMGGRITVESAVGEGSTFALEVPLEPREVGLPRPAPERRRLGFEGPARRVLVVDDEPENRMLLVRLLTPLGFEVREAGSGAEAVAEVLADPPDVVLMDLVMPGVDGFEATRRLRAQEVGRRTPVVALSAAVFEESQAESRKAGCDVFVPKPFREEALFEALDQVLDIAWRFEDPTRKHTCGEGGPPCFEAPPLALVEKLYDLAERGHIVGVRKAIDEVDALGPEHAPLAECLRKKARDFQLQAICELLERFRAPSTRPTEAPVGAGS
jgi:PAS domain S-box-containing protein